MDNARNLIAEDWVSPTVAQGAMSGSRAGVSRLLLWSLAVLVMSSGIFLSGPAAASMSQGWKADEVVVIKSERKLVLRRDGEEIMSFRVALGREPQGHKIFEGDGRTPEGQYVLDWRNPESDFYRAIHISYPNGHDRQLAERYGLPAGGSIMIHGLPNGEQERMKDDHYLFNWTDGCIAVTNEEMDIIWANVEDGTPIKILP
jgi:murein L,D-transpeptidase YafK